MSDRCVTAKKVFISVVSHGHSVMLKELDSLSALAKEYHVVVKNNTYDEGLISFCAEKNITLIDDDYGRGFGFNNNVVYNFCCSELNMSGDDYFLIINPDVVISNNEVHKLVSSMEDNNICAATVNLFKDREYTLPDDSVRKFPELKDFIESFLFGINKTKINKQTITNNQEVDWCAGSFMAFSASAFKRLRGFDTNYFMYCEDIDICYRLKNLNLTLIYFPHIYGLHLAMHENRKIFSRHFWWHIKSIIIFILAKKGFIKNKSNIS